MKILVVYATAGAGHKKAAQAIYEGLKARGHEGAVYLDVLKYTDRLYRKSYSKTYTFLITRTPWLWGFFFWLTGLRPLFGLLQIVRRWHNSLHAAAFHRYLVKEQFDYIFSTHFLSNEVAAYLKRTGRIKSRLICSVTDFDVHPIWLSQGVDTYTVASEWTKKRIIALGVPDNRVAVTGIPVLEKFSSHQDIGPLKEKLRLQDFVFTVLVATGSFGIGPIEQIIEALAGFQVIVVCGHNRSLYTRLRRKEKKLVMVHGLVDNMDELMAVSDAMITKPGGLSISEALIAGLPLIFFHAIPGQESHNIRALKEHGVGISGCRIREMKTVLENFRDSPETYRSARENIKGLARPRAVEDIIALMAR